MSFHVFFSMSTGLSEPLTVPQGTLADIIDRVQVTEETLGLVVEQYRDNPKHWRDTNPKEGVSDKTLCEVAEEHNHYVRWLYAKFVDCQETPPDDGEPITAEEIAPYWHGLSFIDVPPGKWTADYYRARMEALYEALRGRSNLLGSEGITFDSRPLGTRQAANVINLLSDFLDPADIRLDVPLGHDYLAASSDGGYEWCERCGAVTPEYAEACEKKGCPVKAEWGEQEKD